MSKQEDHNNSSNMPSGPFRQPSSEGPSAQDHQQSYLQEHAQEQLPQPRLAPEGLPAQQEILPDDNPQIFYFFPNQLGHYAFMPLFYSSYPTFSNYPFNQLFNNNFLNQASQIYDPIHHQLLVSAQFLPPAYPNLNYPFIWPYNTALWNQENLNPNFNPGYPQIGLESIDSSAAFQAPTIPLGNSIQISRNFQHDDSRSLVMAANLESSSHDQPLPVPDSPNAQQSNSLEVDVNLGDISMSNQPPNSLNLIDLSSRRQGVPHTFPWNILSQRQAQQVQNNLSASFEFNRSHDRSVSVEPEPQRPYQSCSHSGSVLDEDGLAQKEPEDFSDEQSSHELFDISDEMRLRRSSRQKRNFRTARIKKNFKKDIRRTKESNQDLRIHRHKINSSQIKKKSLGENARDLIAQEFIGYLDLFVIPYTSQNFIFRRVIPYTEEFNEFRLVMQRIWEKIPLLGRRDHMSIIYELISLEDHHQFTKIMQKYSRHTTMQENRYCVMQLFLQFLTQGLNDEKIALSSYSRDQRERKRRARDQMIQEVKQIIISFVEMIEGKK